MRTAAEGLTAQSGGCRRRVLPVAGAGGPGGPGGLGALLVTET